MRSTQGVEVLFRIPENCPRNCGLPRKSQKQPVVMVDTMKEDFPDLWAVLGGDNWENRRKKKKLRYGCPHSLAYEQLMHKRRLERYNVYKKKVLELWSLQGIEFPSVGAGIMFYFPIPKRWSNKKRKEMDGGWHQQTPDLGNVVKALEDSILTQDKRIAFYSYLGKKWIDAEQGYIEIVIDKKHLE